MVNKTSRLVTAPADLAVSLAAARISARLDGTDADPDLQQAIRAYTEEAEHITGRALITQTWSVSADGFPPCAVPFALKAPLVSVDHVKYYDTDNVLQTLDPAEYMVDPAAEPGLLAPAPGKTWPATAQRSNAVEIQYTCGYGADDTKVPDAIKSFILAKVQAQFVPVPESTLAAVTRLLDRYKVYA